MQTMHYQCENVRQIVSKIFQMLEQACETEKFDFLAP